MDSSGVSASSRFSSSSKSLSDSDRHQAWASAKMTSTLLASCGGQQRSANRFLGGIAPVAVGRRYGSNSALDGGIRSGGCLKVLQAPGSGDHLSLQHPASLIAWQQKCGPRARGACRQGHERVSGRTCGWCSLNTDRKVWRSRSSSSFSSAWLTCSRAGQGSKEVVSAPALYRNSPPRQDSPPGRRSSAPDCPRPASRS